MLRVKEIAEKFERQLFDQGGSEDNMENVIIQLPAEDVYYIISNLYKQLAENMRWGDDKTEWSSPKPQGPNIEIHVKEHKK